MLHETGGIKLKKKILAAVIAASLCLSGTPVVSNSVAEASGVEAISATSDIVQVAGQTIKIKRNYTILRGMVSKCLPRYSTGSTISYKYESLNPAIATIDASTGAITGIGVGTCIIRVTRTYGTQIAYAHYRVSVGEMKFKAGADSLEVGKTSDYVTNVKNKGIVYTSSNVAAATIDATTGKLTAVAPGTTAITATFKGVSILKVVTVVAKSTESLKITKSSAAMVVGKKQKIETNKTGVSFSSSDPKVATIDKNGNVEALATGSTTIYATYEGATVSVIITVYAKEVGSLEATTDKVTYLTVGDQKIFTANKAGVTWISEQSEVATVDSASGLVKAIAPGTTTIYAISGTETVVFQVVVSNDTQPLGFEKVASSYKVGTTATITVNKKDAVFVSDNPEIASIDAKTGVLTANNIGTCNIFAYHNGVSIKTQIIVDYVGSAEVLQLTPSATILKEGDTCMVESNQKNTSFVSSDTSVATVNSTTGLVTAKKKGEVVIYGVCASQVASVTLAVQAISYSAEQQAKIDNVNKVIREELMNDSNVINVTEYSGDSARLRILQTKLGRARSAVEDALASVSGLATSDFEMYPYYVQARENYWKLCRMVDGQYVMSAKAVSTAAIINKIEELNREHNYLVAGLEGSTSYTPETMYEALADVKKEIIGLVEVYCIDLSDVANLSVLNTLLKYYDIPRI